jgi:3-oxoacyl-[acyl-carrier protein] reductase
VHYGRSAQDAESLVAGILSKGGRANAIRADLGTPEGATLLAKGVRTIVGERLDVLVLNAGISKAARLADYTRESPDGSDAGPATLSPLQPGPEPSSLDEGIFRQSWK